MFSVVQSNDSFNFPLGLIKYIVIVTYLQQQLHIFSLQISMIKCQEYNFAWNVNDFELTVSLVSPSLISWDGNSSGGTLLD